MFLGYLFIIDSQSLYELWKLESCQSVHVYLGEILRGEYHCFKMIISHTQTGLRFSSFSLHSNKPVQDDLMEWPSAELCRPASQHGRCCHEEVSARSSPQVCVSHGVTGVIPKSETWDWHFQHCCSPYVTQNLECYAFWPVTETVYISAAFTSTLKAEDATPMGVFTHSALSKKMLGFFEKNEFYSF